MGMPPREDDMAHGLVANPVTAGQPVQPHGPRTGPLSTCHRLGRAALVAFLPLLALAILLLSLSGLHVPVHAAGGVASGPVAVQPGISAQVRTCWARLNGDLTDYATVQEAVDASTDPNDVVKVAGHCAGVQSRMGEAQAAVITKTITLRGGYTITNWTVSDPVAHPTTLDAMGLGRVLSVTGDVSATVEGLRLANGRAAGDLGGGVYVLSATLALQDSQVVSSTALAGGGIYLRSGRGLLRSTVFTGNHSSSSGGGLYAYSSTLALSGSTVISNTAQQGAGVYFFLGQGTVEDTVVERNEATNHGAGIYLASGQFALRRNTIQDNEAGTSGGGVRMAGGAVAELERNLIADNTAALFGGGIYALDSTMSMTNNVVVDNQAGAGGGVYVAGRDAASGRGARLVQTTVARNGGGLVVTDNGLGRTGIVTMTNSIVASHATGVEVVAGSEVRIEGVLWYGNAANTAGAGTISVSDAHTGDPLFAADGYHIRRGSAAIDRGVDSGVSDDIDGEPRPVESYDLGADEVQSGLQVAKGVDPAWVQAGETLTYTVWVTNIDDVALTTTITDLLPAQVTHPAGMSALVWSPPVPILPGAAWSTQFTATANWGYSGTLVNRVEATSMEGTRGETEVASRAVVTPAVAVSKRAYPSVVQSGELLTYTVWVTNTGGGPLTAAITDVLPAQVTHLSGQGF